MVRWGGWRRTSTDGGWGDESALGDEAGGLLSRDAGDGRALRRLAEMCKKLCGIRTEARRDWTSMMTGVELSIESWRVRGRFGR